MSPAAAAVGPSEELSAAEDAVQGWAVIRNRFNLTAEQMNHIRNICTLSHGVLSGLDEQMDMASVLHELHKATHEKPARDARDFLIFHVLNQIRSGMQSRLVDFETQPKAGESAPGGAAQQEEGVKKAEEGVKKEEEGVVVKEEEGVVVEKEGVEEEEEGVVEDEGGVEDEEGVDLEAQQQVLAPFAIRLAQQQVLALFAIRLQLEEEVVVGELASRTNDLLRQSGLDPELRIILSVCCAIDASGLSSAVARALKDDQVSHGALARVTSCTTLHDNAHIHVPC